MNYSKNILLVEDDTDDQEFFTEALNEIANTNLLAIAKNGKDALEKLENLTTLPDIIFMDVNMPLMNGIECLTSLIKNQLLKHIPIVILTTDIDKKDLVYKLGAKAFIEKSSNGKILREKLEQMINLNFTTNTNLVTAFVTN